MPPLPPVAGVIKAELLWTQSGAPAANIFHIGYSTSPPSSADLASLAARFGGCITTLGWPLINMLSPEVELVEVICTDLSSDSSNIGSASTHTAGSDDHPVISAGSAFLVNWLITRRYRGGHPRTYWPAPTSEFLSSQTTWSSGCLSDMATSMTAFLANLNGQTFGSLVTTQVGAVSYRTGDAPRVTPIFEPFVGYTLNGLVATQRRRIRSSSY